jgi:hypothetical protein
MEDDESIDTSKIEWTDTFVVPPHRVKDINVDHYSVNLDYKIKGKPTNEIKEILYFIQDCISMLNYQNEGMLEIFGSFEDFDKKGKPRLTFKQASLMKDRYIFVVQPLSRLHILCKCLIKKLKEDFGIVEEQQERVKFVHAKEYAAYVNV